MRVPIPTGSATDLTALNHLEGDEHERFLSVWRALSIQRRRDIIDLLADHKNLPALAHELAHVVLADVFGDRRPPPWADEGIATLSDSVEKRRLHERDLQRAIFQRATWPLVTLMTRESHPPVAAFPTFYAQSASLTAFLIRRGSPSQFVRFVKTATTCGYDRALADEHDLRRAEDPAPAEEIQGAAVDGELAADRWRAAEVLGISEPTAKRWWAYARAWIFDVLRPDDNSTSR